MFRKSAYLFVVNMANRVLNYLLRIILRLILGATDFGIFAVILPVQNMLLTVTSYAVSPTVSRYVSKDKAKAHDDDLYPFYFLLLGIVMCIVGLAISSMFASFLSEEFRSTIIMPLRIMFLVLPIGVVFSIFTGIYFGKGLAKNAAIGLLIVQTSTIIFAYLFGFSKGMNGVAFAFFAAYLVAGIYLGVKWWNSFHPNLNASWSKGKSMLKFSLPMLVTSMSIVTIFQVDILILGKYFSPIETSIYGLVMPTSRLVPALSVAMSTMLLPTLSSLSVTDSYEKLKQTVDRAFEVGFVASLPFTLLIFAFSDEVLYVLFDSGTANTALKLLSVGMFFYSMYYLMSSALQGMGKPKIPMVIILSAAFVDICLCFILIPLYGITGAALSTTITMVLAFFTTYAYLRPRSIPKIFNILSIIPLLLFENLCGIIGGKMTTFTVYGVVGIVYLLAYLHYNGLIKVFRDE